MEASLGTPFVMEKVLNWSELHLSEVTSYKIHALVRLNQFHHNLLVQSLEINELSKCSARMCSNMSSLILKSMSVIPKQYQVEVFGFFLQKLHCIYSIYCIS